MAASRVGEQQGSMVDGRANTPPHSQSFLKSWEDCREASPGERGLILLRIASPELSEADRACLSVGRRDALLFDLFRQLFGDTAAALVACPDCGDQLEFDVPLAEIGVTPPAAPTDRYTLVCDGNEIAYRLPCAGDLAALGAERRNDALGVAIRSLAQRCVLAIRDRDGRPADVALTGDAAAALEAAITARVTEADPLAVVTLTFDCPSCAAHWRAPFDIVEFLWRRLDGFARALLRDVHVLASNYGWSEREIVALTPWRRRHYIELIEA
jgi:hypothetical protein